MDEKHDKTDKTRALTARIEAICARQEKSPADVLALLKRWGADLPAAQLILTGLKKNNFVNEERYASAFVRDKVHIEHWGFVKVRIALKQKGIAGDIAAQAIEAIDREEYRRMIRTELNKKHKLLKDATPAAWQKLARFGAGRGYEMDIMYDMLDELCGRGW